MRFVFKGLNILVLCKEKRKDAKLRSKQKCVQISYMFRLYSHHQVEHIIVKIIKVIQCNKIVRTRSGLTLTYRCIKLYKISKLSLMMAVYTAETCSWFAHR
jgi:hypothetical protein